MANEPASTVRLREIFADTTLPMRRDLKSLLSRLFKGCHARRNVFSIIIPRRFFSSWFFHHTVGDKAICYIPPNLHDDERWVGLELYVILKCLDISSRVFFDIYAHGSRTIPILTYVLKIRDRSHVGSLCVVLHVPRESFPHHLNQSQGISALVMPRGRGIEIQMCGTKLLYEQDSDLLIQEIMKPASESLVVLDSIHKQAQKCLEGEIREHIDTMNSEWPSSGYFFFHERFVIQSLQKLLTSSQQVTEEVSCSLQKLRLNLAPKCDYKDFESISLHSKNLFLDDWDCVQGTVGGNTSRDRFNHFHVMIETFLCGSYQFMWKRKLEFVLKDVFDSDTFVTLSLKGYVISTLRSFDPCFTYNLCFPWKDILRSFEHQSSESTVRVQLPSNMSNDNNWRGIVICAAFSVDEHMTSSQDMTSKLQCYLTTAGRRLNVVPTFSITREEFKWLYTRGFIWLTFIPHALLPEWNEPTSVEVEICHDSPELRVNTCAIRLLYQKDVEEFKQTITHLWISLFDNMGPINQFVADNDESYWEFCEDSIDDICFPFCNEIHKWFDQNEFICSAPLKTMQLPGCIDENWIGLTLYAHFSLTESANSLNHDVDPPTLLCDLEITMGGHLSYVHHYRPTSEEVTWLHRHGGLVWVSYLPRRWIRDAFQSASQLSECGIMEASFKSDREGLRAQSCGIRVVYLNDQEKFRHTINCCVRNAK